MENDASRLPSGRMTSLRKIDDAAVGRGTIREFPMACVSVAGLDGKSEGALPPFELRAHVRIRGRRGNDADDLEIGHLGQNDRGVRGAHMGGVKAFRRRTEAEATHPVDSVVQVCHEDQGVVEPGDRPHVSSSHAHAAGRRVDGRAANVDRSRNRVPFGTLPARSRGYGCEGLSTRSNSYLTAARWPIGEISSPQDRIEPARQAGSGLPRAAGPSGAHRGDERDGVQVNACTPWRLLGERNHTLLSRRRIAARSRAAAPASRGGRRCRG